MVEPPHSVEALLQPPPGLSSTSQRARRCPRLPCSLRWGLQPSVLEGPAPHLTPRQPQGVFSRAVVGRLGLGCGCPVPLGRPGVSCGLWGLLVSQGVGGGGILKKVWEGGLVPLKHN